MGPAQVAGRLTATQPGWRFAGTAAVSRTAFGGYALAQASGPLEVSERAGQWDIKTSLAGSGGRGEGYVTAALGGAPKVRFDGGAAGGRPPADARPAGDGLRPEARGERGAQPAGRPDLQGQGGGLQPGGGAGRAAGSAAATWSASQGKAGQPWTFTVDARGDRMATGFPEVDRLLGPKPELKAQANLQGRRLAVGLGQPDRRSGQGGRRRRARRDGGLTFKLDWNANGPFRAGPVEISGAAKGTGAITGTLAAPRADILADVAQIDVPRLPLKDAHVTLSFLSRPGGASGMAALTATSAYGPARARSDFSFPEGGIDLTDLSVDAGGVKASGSLSLRSRTPSAANLEVAVTRGALLDGGRVAGSVRSPMRRAARGRR